MIKATIRGFFISYIYKKEEWGFLSGFFQKKIRQGLEPTKQSLIGKIGKAVAGKSTLMPVYWSVGRGVDQCGYRRGYHP